MVLAVWDTSMTRDYGAHYAAMVLAQLNLTSEDEVRVAQMLQPKLCYPNDLARQTARACGVHTHKPK
jgi:hypothetical protein